METILRERAGGILLHPTSLPGNYGIGTLGKAAFDFIDFLVRGKQQYWQILPLGPTGYADSPYQCFSAHAGNPNLIDLDLLVKSGLLHAEDLSDFPNLPKERVDFEAVQDARLPLLQKAYHSFNLYANTFEKLAYRNFQKDQSNWINDYALFRAIKANREQKPWYHWESPLKIRNSEAMMAMKELLHDEIDFHKFMQFLFFRQWMAVKEYAHHQQVKIIGDIPLYVAFDSADAWANPEIFEFDDNLNPIRVGGVPPDYFSETGQLWGNPLFRWDVLKKTNFRWWIDRIRTSLFLYDIIRIDHFRGFAAYWAIPYAEKTAVNGEWIPGPGKEFFNAMQAEFGVLPIIAEDLGVITPDVEELRDGFGLPGMKILQFAFDASETNDYLPHNYIKNCIVYTGTHDNDTLTGWFKNATPADQQYVLEYINTDEKEIHWSFIRLAWASVANLAIVPMQDLMGLGTSARMNLPGTTQNNWQWRAQADFFTPELVKKLAHLTSLYGRSKINKTDDKMNVII
ncbi:MAG: 4-alpha-glucanotransferase [Bacteroidales bacterium]|nr:4-alpha-glucanotransferase [Bacteroidales bacterium]